MRRTGATGWTSGGWVTELTRWRPAPGAEWVALRASLTVLAGLGVVTAAGAPELSPYASFGAFASVYGGAVASRRRWRLQTALGLLLTVGVACGAVVALSPARDWLAVPVAAAWAAGAARLSDRFGWRPPGPLFLVFAVATCSSIPTTAPRLAAAVAACAATAGFGIALGVLETVVRRAPQGVPSSLPTHSSRRQRVQALRCAAAVAVAGTVATAAGITHPYWAMVAAVAPLTAATFDEQLVRGVHRLVGTLLGLSLAWGLLALPLGTAAVVLVIAGLQAATELTVVRHYGTALIFVTPLALLLTHQADPQPLGALLSSRLVETVLGVVVGVALAVATRAPRPPAT